MTEQGSGTWRGLESMFLSPRQGINSFVLMAPPWLMPLATACAAATLSLQLFALEVGGLGAFLEVAAIGAVVGAVLSYVATGTMLFSSRIFRGQATGRQVQASIAYSCIPSVAAVLLWVPRLLNPAIQDAILGLTPRINSSLFKPPYPPYSSIVELLLLWSLVLLVVSVSEVNRFSIGASIATLVATAISLFLLALPLCPLLFLIFRFSYSGGLL